MTAETTSPPVVAGGMFCSLRIRNFRLYMTGLTVSVAGNWMQNVAVGWLVLQLTDSGTVLGTTSGCCCVSPRSPNSSWPRCSAGSP